MSGTSAKALSRLKYARFLINVFRRLDVLARRLETSGGAGVAAGLGLCAAVMEYSQARVADAGTDGHGVV